VLYIKKVVLTERLLKNRFNVKFIERRSLK